MLHRQSPLLRPRSAACKQRTGRYLPHFRVLTVLIIKSARLNESGALLVQRTAKAKNAGRDFPSALDTDREIVYNDSVIFTKRSHNIYQKEDFPMSDLISVTIIAYLCMMIVIVIVSLITPAPDKEIAAEYEAVTAELNQ